MSQYIPFDLRGYLARQIHWSRATFGPNVRPGTADHIKKELKEIEASDYRDLEEWIDVIILGLDGAWRAIDGDTQDVPMPEITRLITVALQSKQRKNFLREWPDWHLSDGTTAIEHVKERS